MPNLEGQVLKSCYRIEELIGRGGMAEVYKAWDLRRQYHVAIKVMREDLAEDLEFVRRFRQEASALAALAHANIVRFYSFEREGPLAFIVMDYVDGTTLRRRILEAGGTPLPLGEMWSITQQICAALHYAHEENVLHRDVKPGNIMIQAASPTGTDSRVLITDFGIAKAADAATATTVMPGTPAYMSPEQCRSEPLDVRADIYSLGIVVYEMLAGRRPFVGNSKATTGGTRENLRWEQIHSSPPPLERFNPAVPPAVGAVVLKALSKDPDRRWPTAMSFWHALDTAFAAAGLRAPLGAVLAASETQPAKRSTPSPAVQAQGAVGKAASGATGQAELEQGSAPPRSLARQEMPGAQLLRQVPAWAWAVLAVLLLVVVVLVLRGSGEPGGPRIQETAVPVAQVTVVVTATAIKEPTATPLTPEPMATVDEVATEVSRAAAVAATLTAGAPTPTPTSTPTPRPTPTRTPRPTNTLVPTPTPRATSTPTRQPTRRPTSQPTSVPRRAGLIHPAPELLEPEDWQGFKGRDTPVVLHWYSSRTLASDEYFLVETWTGPNFEWYAHHLVKEKELQLPHIFGSVEYWTTFGQKTQWAVTIVQASGKQIIARLSPESVRRHFVWTEVGP